MSKKFLSVIKKLIPNIWGINFLNLNNTKKFKENENEEGEIFLKKKPFWSKFLIFGIVSTSSFTFIFASLKKIDEVVSSRGELQALGAARPIKSLKGGTISLINVKEGEKVKKNDLLLQFDSKLNKEYKFSLLEEIEIEKNKLNKQKEIYSTKQNIIREEINSLQKKLDIETQILEKFNYLVSEGALASLNALQQKNNVQEAEFNLIRAKLKLSETISELNAQNILIDKEIINLQRNLKEINEAIKNNKLISPVDGVVFNLIPSNSGYVAKSGETLLEIIPEGDLEAKIYISNKDIGFIKKQMKTEVRVDSYPFTEFGHLDGELISIANESILIDDEKSQTKFPAYVSIKKQYLEKNGRKYFLRSGQSVSANFIVRKKPVITLLTDVLERTWDKLRSIRTQK